MQFSSTLPGTPSAAADDAARHGRLSVAELLDHLNHALVVLDEQGFVVGHNDAAHRLLELPQTVLAEGALIDDVVRWQIRRGDLRGDADAIVQRVWHHLRTTQTEAHPHVYTYTTASGRTLQGSTIALPGGGWVRVYTDISKHAQALAALRESEARFRSLTELSADWYWEWDAECRYTRLEGRTVEEHDLARHFLGKRPWDVFSPNRPQPRDWAPLQDLIAQRRVFRGWEIQRILPDGQSVWFSLSGMPIMDEHGHCTGYRGVGRNITPRKEAEATVQRLAFYDSLTGLYNRRAFQDQLRKAQAAADRSGQWGALYFIDLDNFKDVNDAYGHKLGDALLRDCAKRLQTILRDEDSVGRLWGDEFVVLLENLGDSQSGALWNAQMIAEKIRAELERPSIHDGQEVQVTPSIGITLFQGSHEAVEEILQRADLAMYQSKAAGRNAIRFFDPDMQAKVMERATLQHELRHGLREQEFALHGQVIVNGGGRIQGLEALIRWRHPKRGMVSPAAFIPLAEQSGLIVPMGQWILEQACRTLARWSSDPERSHWTLAVNLSARQLRQPDLVDTVLRVIDASGCDPKKLKLELTESQLLHDVEDTIKKMEALSARGIRFALDDFGTGYSSLAYLKRLPLSQLKIDRTFVRDLLDDPNDAAIAQTILQLADSLGLDVVAEGVETAAQFEALYAMGCRLFQGYHFGRPAPLDPADPASVH
ncbi:MAG: EAL domain-containing protein [Tepidimonas sp.]|uniref:putative bifunctional diguanylate cyclase/phosphodiesterase n=1 Tax=Tepidimonas sp. TaxID=2002775 RepID=UPI00259F81D0|nr:EAL domain-containing protein [Tepidimonas sp.]MDM7457178.1 EAL domain-containing protein [Tepidimonas sp.]